MKIGKLPAEVLDRLILHPIQQQPPKHKEILIRPKTGEDCAALDFGEEICVVSTDPITAVNHDAGYLAVHINCNDIAASGAVPIGILITALLPPSSTEKTIQNLMDGVKQGAEEVGIEILGGHTEVTDAVVKPIISATVLGKTHQKQFISSGGAKIGQDIIMTKWAGLEGTAILAKDYETVLRQKLGDSVVEKALALKKFLSVVPEGKIAARFGATAMHDVTEGGIFGAVWEVADCSNIGVTIELDKIPLLPQTKAICELMGIDPYCLISSGCMIMTAFCGEKLVKQLQNANISACVIGKMTQTQRLVCSNGAVKKLEQPGTDEIYRAKL